MRLFRAVAPTLLVIFIAVVSALAVVSIITSCDQKPIPVNATPGYPCGKAGYYFECHKGCCWRGTRCGVLGHACGLGECCYIGDEYGGAPDAARGAARSAGHELTPEEARQREQHSGDGR
jgi:hypothetical protein